MSDFFGWLIEFLDSQVWQRIEEFFFWSFDQVKIFLNYSGVAAVEVVGSYVNTILTQVNSSEVIRNAFAALPEDIAAVITLLQVPASLGIIFAAYAAAISIRMIVGVFT